MKLGSDDATASLDQLLDGPEHSDDDTTQIPGGTPEHDRPGSAPAVIVRPRRGYPPQWLAAGAVVFILLSAALWWVTGGRWQSVATPSMGQAAPVGTLVLTRPVATADIRIGDIVTFRSPVTGRTYTHRVTAIDGDGGLHTRGDINGAADPSILHTGDLVGKVVARWWGVGWLIKASPLLLLGGALLWWATRRWASSASRPAIRILGSSILVSICAVLLTPFVNFTVVTNIPGNNSSQLTVVSTGLFPIRIGATGGAHLDLVDGQIGELTATGTAPAGGYHFTSTVHFTPLWWIALCLIWLTPLALAIITTQRHTQQDSKPPHGNDPPAQPRRVGVHRRRPAGTPASRLFKPMIAVTVFVAAAVPSSQSAFAAKVTNTTTTAASNPYFTCKAAATSTASPSFLTYPLSEATFTTATDVSGNNRAGTYNILGSWSASTSRPCPRDTSTTAALSGGITTAQNYISTPTAVTNPTVFSIEIWFKTGANIGGRLIGFGTAQTGTSGQYDRHIYMSDNGQLNFGVYPGAVKVITTPPNTPTTANYADGSWHQAVATLGATGMRLYLDGTLTANDTTVTTAENYTGYWRIGYDNVNAWTNQPSNFNFRGTLAWASVYTTELTPQLIKQHYAAGK